MNSAFSALLNQKIELFKYSFNAASRQAFVDASTGKLIHPGEFGAYRENVLRDFLQLCIPARLEIGNGFILTADGGISTQTDIVIFDRSAIPRVESSEHQRFYPVEGVCAVGEVKSCLSKIQFKDALNKLARVKAIGDHLSSKIPIYRDKALKDLEFNRELIPYDQLFSFLVCESFDFAPDILPQEVDTFYDSDIKQHHKHNLVLSIKDGLLLYVEKNDKSWFYPVSILGSLKNRFMSPGVNKYLHLHYFCSSLFTATRSATIVFPEMTTYMPELVGGTNFNQL